MNEDQSERELDGALGSATSAQLDAYRDECRAFLAANPHAVLVVAGAEVDARRLAARLS